MVVQETPVFIVQRHEGNSTLISVFFSSERGSNKPPGEEEGEEGEEREREVEEILERRRICPPPSPSSPSSYTPSC